MKRIVFTFIALFFVISISYAQGSGDFTMFGCVALPQGDFQDDFGTDACAAKTGFGFGVEQTIATGAPMVGWITSAAVFFNKCEEDIFEKDIEALLQVEVSDLDIGKYMNIPILTGLKFQGPASQGIDVYGLGQVGLNIFKFPSIEGTTADGYEGEFSWDTATCFAFCVGAGFVLNRSVNIGIRYYGLGEPEFEGTFEYSGNGVSQKVKWHELDKNVSMLMIMLGITL